MNDGFVIGITGSLFEPYSSDEATVIKSLLNTTVQGSGKTAVLSHFVDTGISKVAYDWAWEQSIPMIGIAAKDCWDYPCRLVQGRTIYDAPWEDTLEPFANVCNGLIIFSDTDYTDILTDLVAEQGKQVINLSKELANIDFIPDMEIS